MSTVLQPFIFVLQSDGENAVWYPVLNNTPMHDFTGDV